MSLSFVGPGGAFERPWIVSALFRDSVQHHLQGGLPSDSYACIHRMGEALGTGNEGITLPASAVHAETTSARAALAGLPASALAMSIRTRAVVTASFPLPAVRGTALVSSLGWHVPFPVEGAATLRDIFGSFMDELLHVTQDAPEGAVLQVIDT